MHRILRRSLRICEMDTPGTLRLDPVTLLNDAESLWRNVARAWCRCTDSKNAIALFNGLSNAEREAIYHKMATRSVSSPQQVISDGRFLEYAPPRTLVIFVLAHPNLFFDERCWEDSYSDLDYTHPAATEKARKQVLQYYEALLLDALWLSEQGPDDLEVTPRERVLRAMLAVDLLASSMSGDLNGDP